MPSGTPNSLRACIECGMEFQQTATTQKFCSTACKLHNKTDKTPGHGPDGDCWIWTGSGEVYGKLKSNGATEAAHRIAYKIHIGRIPANKFVLHTCDIPRCVNPQHLFVGTHQDNMRDRSKKERHAFGERSGMCKLSAAEVGRARAMYRGGMTQCEIAEIFYVHQTQISRIVRNVSRRKG